MSHEESTPSWRVIHGRNHWNDMLDPLDINLRQSVIHYGELAQVTYDAFITEPASKFIGDCRFRPENILMKCHVSSASMYEVTKFIYATSILDLPEFLAAWFLSGEVSSHESNWIGYVAVATDVGKSCLGRRDIVIAWRGTLGVMEWLNNFQVFPAKASTLLGYQNGEGNGEEHGHIPHGWMSLYASNDPQSKFNKTSARKQVLEEVKRLVELHKDEEVSITITGHSRGAVLSTINALDIVENGVNVPCSRPDTHFPVTAIVFANPRIGDATFRRIFNNMQDLRLLHVRNEPDMVPVVPLGYEHVGVELTIDTRMSNYLKKPGDFSTWHNLEAYLHGVAGTHGIHSGKFELLIHRDIALVNKSCGALEEAYHIPESWWTPTNKGMVKREDGHWELMDSELLEAI